MGTEKMATPAYGSFKSLKTFFDNRREDGHITTVVDRSLMSNFSGSTVTELIGTLRFLKMIDEEGRPTALYERYVNASDEERKPLLEQTVREAYAFVFKNPTFNVERETTNRMADLFRSQGISGSTLSRAISFFLTAVREAGIKVSPNIKAPAILRSPKPKRAVGNVQTPAHDEEDEEEDVQAGAAGGVQSFDIPIPINRKVRILIPADWTSRDWDLFQSMLKVYIEGWKQQASKDPAQGSGAE